MKTKGRRRSKNVEDRRQTGMASPLWTDWPQDATFRGSVDQMMRTGGSGILPYIMDSDTQSIYDPMQRQTKPPMPRANPRRGEPPRPRPNPKRRKKTIAQGG